MKYKTYPPPKNTIKQKLSNKTLFKKLIQINSFPY